MSIFGKTSYFKLKVKSALPSRIFSSSSISIFGCIAVRSLRSAKIERGASLSISLRISAIKDLPYIFRKCPLGTLPGRKPLSLIFPLVSSNRSFNFSSKSFAGTTILISRFSPSLSVSVTCIKHLHFSKERDQPTLIIITF